MSHCGILKPDGQVMQLCHRPLVAVIVKWRLWRQDVSFCEASVARFLFRMRGNKTHRKGGEDRNMRCAPEFWEECKGKLAIRGIRALVWPIDRGWRTDRMCRLSSPTARDHVLAVTSCQKRTHQSFFHLNVGLLHAGRSKQLPLSKSFWRHN